MWFSGQKVDLNGRDKKWPLTYPPIPFGSVPNTYYQKQLRMFRITIDICTDQIFAGPNSEVWNSWSQSWKKHVLREFDFHPTDVLGSFPKSVQLALTWHGSHSPRCRESSDWKKFNNYFGIRRQSETELSRFRILLIRSSFMSRSPCGTYESSPKELKWC